MSNSFNFLTGAGIGAGLMYLMDPDRGNRRRMLVRDQAVHGLHLGARAADKAIRDLQNRARGTVAEAWAGFRREEMPDAVIAERVRARLGRLVSHPNSIEVTAQQGRVTLSGPVLEHEVRELISRVRSIRGVRDVNNRLDIHKQPGNVPGLQGGSGRTGQRIELLQENWAPGTRLLVGAAGLMAIAGARGRGIIKTPLALAGAGMLLRAATNLPLRRSLGLDGSRRGIEFQKTVHIAATVEEVCAVWC
ncbi:MAG TPA: BON domain-containing protein, partial [Terriglobales bacterium]|nr:BON domain-containing protein [Terriglobales bacterium]